MPTVIGIAKSDGGIDMTEYQRAQLKQFLKQHTGKKIRIVVDKMNPESTNQRRFLEGAVIPLVTFFQEGMDYRDPASLATVRDWLKIEFNGEYTTVGGKTIRVGRTTKGELSSFIEKVIEFLEEQYGIDRMKVLNPDDYKHFRDVVYPYANFDSYIDYLISLHKL